MAYDGSRRAGEWARARSQREWRISGVLILAMTAGIAAFVFGVLLGVGIGLVAPLATASLLAGWFALKRADVAVPWTKGALSEERVGAILDGLRSDGYLVVHDVVQSGEGTSTTWWPASTACF